MRPSPFLRRDLKELDDHHKTESLTDMPRLTPEDRIKKATQAKAKAEEVIKRASRQLRDQDRKADTRRKIILGGMLLDAASKNQSASKFIKSAISRLDRPSDQALFQGFDVPQPPSGD